MSFDPGLGIQIVGQMSSSDESISTLVPWSATDQHAGICFLFIDSCDRLGARKTRKFHELI